MGCVENIQLPGSDKDLSFIVLHCCISDKNLQETYTAWHAITNA